MKDDKQMLTILHLSQLLIITGIGGIIAPLILWQLKKDEVNKMDAQGKMVVNFQLSLLVYGIIGFITTFLFVGIFILIAVGLLGVIFPIINGIKVNNGEEPQKYPLSIQFIK